MTLYCQFLLRKKSVQKNQSSVTGTAAIKQIEKQPTLLLSIMKEVSTL